MGNGVHIFSNSSDATNNPENTVGLMETDNFKNSFPKYKLLTVPFILILYKCLFVKDNISPLKYLNDLHLYPTRHYYKIVIPLNPIVNV